MKAKRNTIKTLLTASAALTFLPQQWQKPMVNTILLPTHAQTSPQVCSGYDTEPIDERIFINVTDTQINGPIVASRNGQGFSETQTRVTGQCTDLDGSGKDLSEEITFTGSIDSASSQITGDLTIRQYCGDTLVCEQLTTFTAEQNPVNDLDDLGDYEGPLTGTLRCCRDFL